MSDLRNIDFSNGIRSEDIQYNFSAVEQEIARERLSIAGHGISSGLDFSIDGFTLTVAAGTLVDLDGSEVRISQVSIPIQLPRLIAAKQGVYTIQANGQIGVANIPYANSRLCPSQYALPSDYGISLVDYSNSSKSLPVMNIVGTTINTDPRWSGQLAVVNYNYTNKRYDTVYIDEDYAIKVVEGITSTSPSVTMPETYKYILGFIEVNPFAIQNDGSVKATISVKQDMKNFRNLYTDAQNNLYICGMPFDDLQIIHMTEPATPVENELWYDPISNKLKVWKTIDAISEWYGVNDTSIIPVLEYKIWTPEENPMGGQVFMFHYTNDMNMRFIPNKNEIELLIDNGPLHSDQFEEITLDTVMADAALKQLIITNYGYTQEVLDQMHTEYENVGLGFKLGTPLDKACYVEARITHRVNDNPLQRRFQRTATFVSEDSFDYNPDNGKVFATNAPYKILENQLEVFIDGKRMDPKTGFAEGTDLDVAARVKGVRSRQFTILSDIPANSRIAYKITTSVYSYDDVESVVGDLATRVETAETTVTNAVSEMNNFVTTTDQTVSELQNSVEQLNTKELEHDNFVKKTDVLTEANMPASINTWIPKGQISLSVTKNGTAIPVAGISPEDFILMFDIQSAGGNSILRRGEQYDVTKDAGSGTVYINFIDANAVPDGHTLYITGIKFKV